MALKFCYVVIFFSHLLFSFISFAAGGDQCKKKITLNVFTDEEFSHWIQKFNQEIKKKVESTSTIYPLKRTPKKRVRFSRFRVINEFKSSCFERALMHGPVKSVMNCINSDFIELQQLVEKSTFDEMKIIAHKAHHLKEVIHLILLNILEREFEQKKELLEIQEKLNQLINHWAPR